MLSRFRRLSRVRSVEVLRLQPGDHIIIECPGRMTEQQVELVREQVGRQFRGHPVSVLSDLSLKVVRSEP